MHHHFHHRHGGRSFEDGLSFMGRRQGRHGFGPFGDDFMGARRPGGGAFRTGRKLGSADLQLLILSLLAEAPSHGYELIKALEERSGGFYSPSPGMVYPALTYLEEIGYATVQAEGARKRYHITEEGRAHLQENQAAVDAILTQLERIAERMDSVRKAFSGDESGEDEQTVFGILGSRALWTARRALKTALREKKHGSPEQIERIAGILQRAADEILGL